MPSASRYHSTVHGLAAGLGASAGGGLSALPVAGVGFGALPPLSAREPGVGRAGLVPRFGPAGAAPGCATGAAGETGVGRTASAVAAGKEASGGRATGGETGGGAVVGGFDAGAAAAAALTTAPVVELE